MSLKIRITKESIINLIFFLYQVLNIVSIAFSQLRFICTGIGIAILVYVLIFSSRRLKYSMILLAVYFVGFVSNVHTSNYRVNEFAMIAQYAGIGFFLLEYRVSYSLSKLSFIFASAFYLLGLCGLMSLSLFTYLSNNYVSINIIYYCAVIFISIKQNHLSDNIVPFVVTALICIISAGRASVICGVLLLCLFYVYYLWKREKLQNKKAIIGIVIAICVFGILLGNYFELLKKTVLYSFYYGRESETGLASDGRIYLMREYMSRMTDSLGNFILGVPCRQNRLFLLFGSNWHNSYIRIHCFFGMAGLLVFLLCTVRTAIVSMKYAKWVVLFLLVIEIRMITDSAAVNGTFDPLLYYFFLFMNFEEADVGDMYQQL